MTCLKQTCILAVIMTIIFEAWCIWVFQDGNPYTRGNLTFFLALTEVSSAFCLMTLRAAAMRVALVSTGSFIFYFSWAEDWQMLSQSIVLCIVASGMVVVTHGYNLSFSALIRSQRNLRIRQRETEKLSEETAASLSAIR